MGLAPSVEKTAVAALESFFARPADTAAKNALLHACWTLVKDFLPVVGAAEFLETLPSIRVITTATAEPFDDDSNEFGMYVSATQTMHLRTPAVLTAMLPPRIVFNASHALVIIACHELVHAWQAFATRFVDLPARTAPGDVSCMNEAHATFIATQMAERFGFGATNALGLRFVEQANAIKQNRRRKCYYAFQSDADKRLLHWWQTPSVTNQRVRVAWYADGGGALVSEAIDDDVVDLLVSNIRNPRSATFRIIRIIADAEARGIRSDVLHDRVRKRVEHDISARSRCNLVFRLYALRREAALKTAIASASGVPSRTLHKT